MTAIDTVEITKDDALAAVRAAAFVIEPEYSYQAATYPNGPAGMWMCGWCGDIVQAKDEPKLPCADGHIDGWQQLFTRAVEEPGRSIIHCNMSFSGADWDLEDVESVIESATRIAWVNDLFDHELAVESGAKAYRFGVKRPAEVSHG